MPGVDDLSNEVKGENMQFIEDCLEREYKTMLAYEFEGMDVFMSTFKMIIQEFGHLPSTEFLESMVQTLSPDDLSHDACENIVQKFISDIVGSSKFKTKKQEVLFSRYSQPNTNIISPEPNDATDQKSCTETIG